MPVIESAPVITELPDLWLANVSVIACAEPPAVVTTSAAPSIDALSVRPPVAVLDMLTTTSRTFVVPAVIFRPMLEKLYLPLTGAEVFHWIKLWLTPEPSNKPASSAELLYRPTRTISASVCVPLSVMFNPVIFICSPVAEKLNDIIVTLVEPIWVVVATLLVPVIERLP